MTAKKDDGEIAIKDEEIIEIPYMDDKGNKKFVKKKIRTNIFQPANLEKTWFRAKCRKFAIWLLDMTKPRQNRFIRLHLFLKPYIMYPVFKLIRWFMGKNTINDDKDIVHEWYNNPIRIFRHCFHESVDNIYRILIYNQGLYHKKGKELEKFKGDYPTPQIFLKKQVDCWAGKKTFGSLHARKLACDIFVNAMLEDTADREWCNYFTHHLAIEMCLCYGLNPEEIRKIPQPGRFPVYLADGPHMPDFFRPNATADLWLHPDERGKIKPEDKVQVKDKKTKKEEKKNENRTDKRK